MKKLYSFRAKKRIEKIDRIKASKNDVLEITYGDERKKVKILEHKIDGNIIDPRKCSKCGKPLIPDKKALNHKGKWDGHTYKWNCKCNKNKKLRMSIG